MNPEAQDPDVQEEPSTSEPTSGIKVDGATEDQVIEEVVEPEAEVQPEDPAPEPEVPQEEKPQRVPLTRLKQEITKRKELEQQLAEARSRPQVPEPQNETVAQATPQETGRPKRPTLKESEYDEAAHETAMEEYDVKLEEYQYSKFEQRSEAKLEKQNQDTRQKEFNQKVEDLYNTDEEYKTAVNEIMDTDEQISYSQVVKEAIAESADGVLLDRYILVNRAEILPRLASMTPMQQAMEMGKIQASLQITPETIKPNKPVSKAPQPIETSTGSGNVSTREHGASKITIY